jgi:hypothetical protein
MSYASQTPSWFRTGMATGAARPRPCASCCARHDYWGCAPGCPLGGPAPPAGAIATPKGYPTPYLMWEAYASSAGACPISHEYRASATCRLWPFGLQACAAPAYWHVPEALKQPEALFAGWGLGRDAVPAPNGRAGCPLGEAGALWAPLACSPGLRRAQSHLAIEGELHFRPAYAGPRASRREREGTSRIFAQCKLRTKLP